MPLETIAPSPTPGAGRTFDVVYPTVVAGNFNIGGGLTNNATSRTGSALQFALTSQTGYQTGGTASAQKYKGAMCFRYASGATAGAGVGTNLPICLNPITEPLGVSASDAWRCWSARFLVAWDNPAAAVGNDFGLMLMAYNKTQWFGAGNYAGMYLGVTGPQTLTFQARRLSGGGLTVNQAIANPPDVTQWNNVEMRVIGADRNAAAVLKILINGALVMTQTFGAAAAVLPDIDAAGGGFAGYQFNWNSISGGVNLNMYVARVQLIAAPTEAALG